MSSDETPLTFTLRCERIRPDVPNINNRVYTAPVLKKIVSDSQDAVRHRRLMGGLTQDSPQLNLSEVSHVVTVFRQDVDGCLSADVEVLDTEKGRILADMMATDKSAYEVVPNGMGSLRDGVVQDDYKLSSLDVVPRLPKEYRHDGA